MQLSSKEKEFDFFLCVVDIFTKYALVIPLKNKKGITIANACQKFLNKSKGHKPNQIKIDKGNKSYNRSAKSWLQDIQKLLNP